jgi:hypothetical protein
MSDQNSGVSIQVRPDDLMSELNIGRDAYYTDLKFLSVTALKDGDGKAYLTEEQANAVRALRSHVSNTGKRDGFFDNNSAITVQAATSGLDEVAPPVPVATEEEAAPTGDQFEELIRAAAELKGQRLVTPELVIQELANRMTYEDLPADVQAKVDGVRAATSPKFQPVQLADQLLTQWRTQRSAAVA